MGQNPIKIFKGVNPITEIRWINTRRIERKHNQDNRNIPQYKFIII